MLDVRPLFAATSCPYQPGTKASVRLQGTVAAASCSISHLQCLLVALVHANNLCGSQLPRSSRHGPRCTPAMGIACMAAKFPSGSAAVWVARAASPHSKPTQLPEALQAQVAQGSDQHSTPDRCQVLGARAAHLDWPGGPP